MPRIRIIICSIICIVFLSGTMFSVSAQTDLQCESTTICDRPAETFVEYTEFVTNVLAEITTVVGEGNQLGRQNGLGLFTNKVLTIDERNKNIVERLLDGVMQNIVQKAQTVQALTTILLATSIDAITKDGTLGLAVLFQSRPIVRDRKTLMDIETNLHDTVYDLGLAGVREKKLIDEDSTAISDVFTNYAAGNNSLFTGATLQQGAKYRHVIQALLQLNSKMKRFVAIGDISHLETVQNNGVTISFDPERMQRMKMAYRCGRGLTKCDQRGREKFKENISSVTKDNIEGAKRAGDTITDALKRLQNAYDVTSKQIGRQELDQDDQAYLSREAELLRTNYGLNTTKIREGGFLGINTLVEGGSKRTTIVKQLGQEQDYLDQQHIQFKGEVTAEVPQKDGFWRDNQLTVSIQTAFDQTLQQQDHDMRSAIISETKDITAYVELTTAQIRQIRKEMIGTKDTSGLVKYLGEACELQCTNVGGKCFY